MGLGETMFPKCKKFRYLSLVLHESDMTDEDIADIMKNYYLFFQKKIAHIMKIGWLNCKRCCMVTMLSEDI